MDERQAQSILSRAGLPDAQLIGAGMEGHVFRLDQGTVAKVWHSAAIADVQTLQGFYEALQPLHLPFRTPVILDVLEADGFTVDIEEALTGIPLLRLVSRHDPEPEAFAVDAMMTVLAALRKTQLGLDTPALAMVNVPSNTGTPTERLLAVATEKVDRFGDQLRAGVPDFDAVWESVRSELREQPGSGRYAIHGDLCPPNILLHEDQTVSAVVDWGFLSHAGDLAFETAVTTCIFDMYGPHHRHIDDLLLKRCAAEFGEDIRRLLVYRALYAIMTSNAYAEDGSDGHFAWCVGMLNRPDVREAIGA